MNAHPAGTPEVYRPDVCVASPALVVGASSRDVVGGRVYVDGSALCRYLPLAPHGEEWRTWAQRRIPALVTSTLAVLELTRVASRGEFRTRMLARQVAGRIEPVRFSDQALACAAMATSVLAPFAALHLGVAVTQPDVTMIATYDPALAAVAEIHGLVVVTPGFVPGWWDPAAHPAERMSG